jgi:hypothetical protein
MSMHKRGVRRLVLVTYSAEPAVHALSIPYENRRDEKHKQQKELQAQAELQVWESEGGNAVTPSPATSRVVIRNAR